jgi:5-enolpyruvylshikimate-3-phosphate synthase
MAFAVAGLVRRGVTIDDAGVVVKSYPGFWDDFAGLVRTES